MLPVAAAQTPQCSVGILDHPSFVAHTDFAMPGLCGDLEVISKKIQPHDCYT